MRILIKNIYNLTFFYPKQSGIDAVQTGQNIKEICKSHGLTVKMIQSQLYLGTFQSVYAWFSGKSLPSLENIYRLSQILQVPIDDLIIGAGIRYEIWIDHHSMQTGSFENLILKYYNRGKPLFSHFQI